MENKDYREWMIEELLKRKNVHCTRDELNAYSTRSLERLFDNVD